MAELVLLKAEDCVPLRREVLRHCDILGGEPAAAMDYLMASLGHLGLNLGEFPAGRYCETSLTCFNELRNALG